MVVDELPDVLRHRCALLEHHPVIIVWIQADAQLGHPLVQPAEVTGEDRGVLHPPDHQRRVWMTVDFAPAVTSFADQECGMVEAGWRSLNGGLRWLAR